MNNNNNNNYEDNNKNNNNNNNNDNNDDDNINNNYNNNDNDGDGDGDGDGDDDGDDDNNTDNNNNNNNNNSEIISPLRGTIGYPCLSTSQGLIKLSLTQLDRGKPLVWIVFLSLFCVYFPEKTAIEVRAYMNNCISQKTMRRNY